jgi:hypothetical protein
MTQNSKEFNRFWAKPGDAVVESGALHQVMGRGIERIKTFRNDVDGYDLFYLELVSCT